MSARWWAVVLLLAMAHPAQAQNAPPPDGVLSLVVKIVTRVKSASGTFLPRESGAGVVVGLDERNVYIATARHVVAEGEEGEYVIADSVYVTFFGQDSAAKSVAHVVLLDSAYVAGSRAALTAALARRDTAAARIALLGVTADSARIEGADLALLVVPRPRDGIAVTLLPRELNRLGDARALGFGDPVIPLGCPSGECWRVPASTDRVIGLRPQLLFQTAFVRPGSSGGALFNQWWEVVGLVITRDTPIAEALPMRDAVDMLVRACVPVGITLPTYPRAGYHRVLSMTFLASSDHVAVPDSVAAGWRSPSSRITLSRRGASPFALQGSLVRLSPYNMTVNAALAGASFQVRVDRLTIEPFADFGLGRVETRYDAGGYYETGSDASSPRYVPLWVREHQDGIGVGGGVEAGYLIRPHYRLTATMAHWSFSLTPHAPVLPTFFFGGGLRWER
ncbi:MAG: serine protease [Gemmatimonadaceae bacterium]